MHYNRLMRYGDINTIRQNKAGLAKKYPEMAQVLYGIKQRCTNPNEANYKFYGGRGIKVCDRWLDKVYGLQNFINDMGIRPTGKTPQGRAFWSIDRIDKDGDYCPENCKWSTWWEQAKNQRNREHSSRYTGVGYDKYRNKLYAYLNENGHQHKTRVDTEEEAYKIRLQWEEEYINSA